MHRRIFTGVAEVSRPAVLAVAVEPVDFVLALPVHAGVGQAFVDLWRAEIYRRNEAE